MSEKDLEHINHDEDMPIVDEYVDESQKKDKHRIMKCLAVIGIIIIIILLLLHSCQSGNVPENMNTDDRFAISVDENAGDETEGLSEEEIVAALNEKIKQSEINMSMNANPVFANGTAEGNLLIKNSEVNNYPQMVEIYLSDGKLVYKSGLIPIGKVVESASLLEDLDAGTYPAVAHFYNIETEENTETGEMVAHSVGEACVEIQIIVQN